MSQITLTLPVMLRILSLVIIGLLISACTPKAPQPVTVNLSFITLAPTHLLTSHNRFDQHATQQWLNDNLRRHQTTANTATQNQSYLAFYSYQWPSQPVLTPAFSYVTALMLNPVTARQVADSLLPEQAILASNINFGTAQYGAQLYAYNPKKARAEAFVQQVHGEHIAYLSLIRQSSQPDASPQTEDLQLIANTVDRLQIQGINKIVLLSQFAPTYAPQIVNAVKGLDVVISSGEQAALSLKQNTTLATFPAQQMRWHSLSLHFDDRGRVQSAEFLPL
ncbi:hypothetical protein [Photobacterium ganghwense]|uniref:hypothetical protein n=1 Tax=Photobacterium ganghwense TaxID=320778 RepID=UPI001C2D9AA4|nr:hypothetical protein [Photobacterium ganghwense]MBV1842335.1 hypothetical protein [Photobacterium ganghwense]